MFVQVFDGSGSFLSYINTSADPLYGPQGLALTSDGHVVVADSGNHCFKVYRYLQWRRRALHWGLALETGTEFSMWDQITMGLFTLGRTFGKLSKVISECNNFLKNCLSNFRHSLLAFKKKKRIFYWIYTNCEVLHLGTMAHRTGIYVVKLILQIRH